MLTAGSPFLGLEDGWKDVANAVSNHPIDSCSQVDYKGIKVYSCKGTLPDANNTPGFMLNAEGGGCVGGDGKPIRMDNTTWSQYTFSGNNAPKANTPAEGLTEHTQTGTLKTDSTKTVTCTHRGGMFNADLTPFTGTSVQGKMFARAAPILAQNGKCSAIPLDTESNKLASLRCYANHFYSSRKGGGGDDETTCRRRLRTDWSATKAEQFIAGKNGPAQVENQFLMEKVEYTDANTASFRQEEDDMRGFPTKEGYVNCRVKSMATFSMKKLAEGKLLVEMIEDKKLVDTGKADCKAESEKPDSEISEGRSKTMFLLVK